MFKIITTVSVLLNLVLGGLYYLSLSTIQHERMEIDRVEGVYATDINILEILLKESISKSDAMKRLETQLEREDYFDKPSENGIGAGYLFLVFDDDGMFDKIKKYDFSRKTL